MNYIDKEKSIKADIASIENRVRHAFNQGYDFGFKDGKEKAKSQESVLDKIRAEISEYKDDKIIHAERNEMIDIVLEIIDKYKGESEDSKNDKI